MLNITTIEEALAHLNKERDLSQISLDTIIAKYSGGGFYSKEDSSDEDYLEGKVTGLELAIWTLKQLKGKK